jgi:hypothetical protein
LIGLKRVEIRRGKHIAEGVCGSASGVRDREGSWVMPCHAMPSIVGIEVTGKRVGAVRCGVAFEWAYSRLHGQRQKGVRKAVSSAAEVGGGLG